MERPNTCIAYARISSKKQSQGESLGDQEKAFTDYSLHHNMALLPEDHPWCEVFSGSTSNRPVWNEIIAYIKANPGTVGHVLIKHIDRFSRGGVSGYEAMKEELEELGVLLIDVYGFIQQKKNLPELEALGFSYGWSQESPSEMAETMVSITANQERKRILGRTIPKQIEYTQRGYQIGKPNDGYINQRIEVDGKLRYILAPDPERARFYTTMFQLRAQGDMTDQQIVDAVNAMGYRSQVMNRWNPGHTKIVGKSGGIPLTIKQLQRVMTRTEYAGIKCEKWTHNKPIKAQYAGLVSIELFNKASNGAVYIQENTNNSYSLFYNYKPEKEEIRRQKNNPDYPFKCIMCPECGKPFKGSSSRGKSGRYFAFYHCDRGHKRFAVNAKQMELTVIDYVKGLHFLPEYLSVLQNVLVRKFRERQVLEVEKSRHLNGNIATLKAEQKSILEAIVRSKSDTVMAMLEKQLEDIENQIRNTEKVRYCADLGEADIVEMVKYAKQIVEHPEKVLIDKENPLRQRKLFELIFDDLPTYQQLVSGTPKLSFVFNALGMISAVQNLTESHLG